MHRGPPATTPPGRRSGRTWGAEPIQHRRAAIRFPLPTVVRPCRSSHRTRDQNPKAPNHVQPKEMMVAVTTEKYVDAETETKTKDSKRAKRRAEKPELTT